MGGVTRTVGQVGTSRASFTRPANTTQYAAGDVVSDSSAVMTFPNALREFMGTIKQATLIDSANQGTLLDSELWLFDTDPGVTTDNAAIDWTDAEVLRVVGVISFAVANGKVGLAGSGASGNAVNVQSGLNIPVRGLQTNDLYGVLVARNTYTPVSAEVFTVILAVQH